MCQNTVRVQVSVLLVTEAMHRYCDTECQKLHWSEHKKICTTI
jgi:hypothetical protein